MSLLFYAKKELYEKGLKAHNTNCKHTTKDCAQHSTIKLLKFWLNNDLNIVNYMYFFDVIFDNLLETYDYNQCHQNITPHYHQHQQEIQLR